MRNFGLIGKTLEHSFSRKYFQDKFLRENISDANYILLEIDNIYKALDLVSQNTDLKGFNVTTPYKEAIIPLLDYSDSIVTETGSCNCVKIIDGKLHGFNTDVHGFMKSIIPLIEHQHHQAIILGNGGVSKSVIYAFEQISIDYIVVARTPKNNTELPWDKLSPELVAKSKIIVNTTPLGMYPNINEVPPIPYEAIDRFHLIYDLIYNPLKTRFLLNSENHDAVIKNGLEMLYIQAEKSWQIWNTSK